MSEPTGSPQRPETIYLVATSGHANFGDELIAAAWLRFLAQRRPDAEVILDCGAPGMATHLFDGLHPNLKTTDSLWRVVWGAMAMPRSEAVAYVDRVVSHLGSPGWDYGLLAARRATTIHFLGGGHIATHWPHHELLLRAGTALRDVCGARLVATGLGLEPLENPEEVAKWLGGFDHATARDDTSAAAAGIPQIADDAFLDLDRLPAFAVRQGDDDGRGDVWVGLQRDLADEAAFDAMIASVRRVLASDECAGRTVRYAEASPGGDRVAFERLSDVIPEENFVPFVRLWDEPFPAKPGQVWLTTRFHLHLLAAVSGAAGVAFDIDDDYYRTKHQSLLAAGSGWTSVRAVEGGTPVPAVNPEFRSSVGRLRRSKVEEADLLYPTQPRVRPAVEEPAPAPRGRPTGRFGRRR